MQHLPSAPVPQRRPLPGEIYPGFAPAPPCPVPFRDGFQPPPNPNCCTTTRPATAPTLPPPLQPPPPPPPPPLLSLLCASDPRIRGVQPPPQTPARVQGTPGAVAQERGSTEGGPDRGRGAVLPHPPYNTGPHGVLHAGVHLRFSGGSAGLQGDAEGRGEAVCGTAVPPKEACPLTGGAQASFGSGSGGRFAQRAGGEAPVAMVHHHDSHPHRAWGPGPKAASGAVFGGDCGSAPPQTHPHRPPRPPPHPLPPSPQQHVPPPPLNPQGRTNKGSPEESGHGDRETQGAGRPHSPEWVQSAGGGKGKDKRERIIVVVRSPCQEHDPADAHPQRAQVSAGVSKPPHGPRVCVWMPLVTGTGNSLCPGRLVIRGLR